MPGRRAPFDAGRPHEPGRVTPLAMHAFTLAIDLPGLVVSTSSVVPDNSSVQRFRNAKLEEWRQTAATQGYQNAARTMLQITNAYDSQQVALDLGFNAKWASGSTSAQIGVASTTERSVVLAYFKQVFYPITMDTPPSPAAVFDDDVTLAEAQGVFNIAHPPAYVRSVDYGRVLMVKTESSAVDTAANLKGAFRHASGTNSASGSLDATNKDIVKNSSFQVLAIGGGAQDSAALFDGSSDAGLVGLQQVSPQALAIVPTTRECRLRAPSSF